MKVKPPVGRNHTNLQRYLGRVYTNYDGVLALDVWIYESSRKFAKALRDGTEVKFVANVEKRAPGISVRGTFHRGTVVMMWSWRDGNKERLHIEPWPVPEKKHEARNHHRRTRVRRRRQGNDG